MARSKDLRIKTFKVVGGFPVLQGSRKDFFIAGVHFKSRALAIDYYENVRERLIKSLKALDKEFKEL